MKEYIYKGVSGFNSTIARHIEKGDKVTLDDYRAEIMKRSNLIEEVKKATKKSEVK